MLIFLATLLSTLYSILRSRTALELENLALRHQIGVLQCSARNRRPKLTALDRVLWAWLSRVWSDWRWPWGYLFAKGGPSFSGGGNTKVTVVSTSTGT
jgi:hypothetical protein